MNITKVTLLLLLLQFSSFANASGFYLSNQTEKTITFHCYGPTGPDSNEILKPHSTTPVWVPEGGSGFPAVCQIKE